MLLSKLEALLHILTTNPAEACDRAIIAAQRRFEVEDQKVAEFTAKGSLAEVVGFSIEDICDDPTAEALGQVVRQGLESVAGGPLNSAHNSDLSLACLCYGVCRSRKPKVVVETGVAHGVTSRFILHALEQNGVGELWSIDLPPLDKKANRFVGAVVPSELRSRWHLVRGATRRHLPKILDRFPSGIDIFLHDSLHTYRNMYWEFETAWQNLNFLLIADDVEQNDAFHNFVSRVEPKAYCTVKERDKQAAFGVARKI
jgi:hypothetical protein